jgi:hypothetical protein
MSKKKFEPEYSFLPKKPPYIQDVPLEVWQEVYEDLFSDAEEIDHKVDN